MKKIWITYSWEDNKDQSIDFVAQELEKVGLKIHLDKWTIQAGQRLWEQIEKYITDKKMCDGWLFYITKNSLGSEPCKEEFAYALDRALSNRGCHFPLIGLSPTNLERSLIPAAIKTRLHVSLRDDDWKERIVSSIENIIPSIYRPNIDPFTIDFYQYKPNDRDELWNVIEVRPRAGTWSPSLLEFLLTRKTL